MGGRGRVSAYLAATGCVVVLGLAAGVGSGATRTAGEVAIFYYPWYSTPIRDGAWAHWYVERDGAPVLSTPFFPSRGLYSSSNTKVVGSQMREIAGAGVDTVVISWWGPGSPEDQRLGLVADIARRFGLGVAIHLEPYIGRTPSLAADEILRLRELGFTDFYVYDADRDPAAEWSEALTRVEDVRVFGHTLLVGRAKVSGFDGVYTYDVGAWNGALYRRICTQAHRAGLVCSPSVGPGYDARLSTELPLVRPRLNGVTYDRMWKTALRAQADVVTITSYNEWQEGTQIEPARPQNGTSGYEGAWGQSGLEARRAYVDATARWIDRLHALAAQ